MCISIMLREQEKKQEKDINPCIPEVKNKTKKKTNKKHEITESDKHSNDIENQPFRHLSL